MPTSSAPDLYGHPDPIVTGSLYCSGCLDQALLALVPFRGSLRELGREDLPYLWTMRYARGGEHLKVRAHGPSHLEAAVREALEAAAESLLRSLGPPPAGIERHIRADAIPIDVEDRAEDAPPDRSFRFTRYERSQVSLGGEPYLSDDGYRARITVCLARGCDLALSALADQAQASAQGQRQRRLIRAVLTGLAALRLPVERAASYLAYHRDWLIRFPLLRKGGEEASANALLADLDRKASREERTVATLREIVRQVWGETAPEAGGETADAWGQALAELRRYSVHLCGEPDGRLDPFAEDPSFTPVFKALHGLANQLGLKGYDEIYAYHLLLRAAVADGSRYQRISLTPP